MFRQLFEFFHNKRSKIAVLVSLLIIILTLNQLWDLWGKWGWVSPPLKDSRTITISAEGKVTASPDTAKIQLSVVTDGKTADEVQQKNSEDMNKVTDFIKSSGVETKDIKTTYYNLYPKYDYVNGRQIPAGYSLSQTLEVKIRDLKKTGQILTGAVARGANQVSGVEFFVDDPDNLKAQARQQAFDKAKTKAKELAKLAQVRLGKVITFSESSSGQPPIFYEKALGLGGGGPIPDIQSGSQEIIVSVNVVFEIR
ncbi:MAG: SIMPL domain-containing protein [Patescibacteria group bacterium]